MLSTEFIRSISRTDIAGLDHLADAALNKKLLYKLLICSTMVSKSGDGVIWCREASRTTGVFFFVSQASSVMIGLCIPYREIVLTLGLSAIEVSCWQSSAMCGWNQEWQIARDEVFGILLRRSQLLVSSDYLTPSGRRYWEDRVGQHILAGGRGGSVRDGVLIYQHEYSWFAPEDLGRDASSRFFLEAQQKGSER